MYNSVSHVQNSYFLRLPFIVDLKLLMMNGRLFSMSNLKYSMLQNTCKNFFFPYSVHIYQYVQHNIYYHLKWVIIRNHITRINPTIKDLTFLYFTCDWCFVQMCSSNCSIIYCFRFMFRVTCYTLGWLERFYWMS